MIEKLKCIFSKIVSAAVRAFWAAKLRPADLVEEGFEIQRIRTCVEPEIAADAALFLKGESVAFCTDSMEITLHVKPQPGPPGFLKMLDILKRSMA